MRLSGVARPKPKTRPELQDFFCRAFLKEPGLPGPRPERMKDSELQSSRCPTSSLGHSKVKPTHVPMWTICCLDDFEAPLFKQFRDQPDLKPKPSNYQLYHYDQLVPCLMVEVGNGQSETHSPLPPPNNFPPSPHTRVSNLEDMNQPTQTSSKPCAQ